MNDQQKIEALQTEAANLEFANGEQAATRRAQLLTEIETLKRGTITPTPTAAVLLQVGHQPWDRYKIRCVETGVVYESAAACAHAFKCSKGAISNHLSGRHPHIRGKHLERVEG